MLKNIKKLYNLNLCKTEYIDFLPLVDLYDFCLRKIVTCHFDLISIFRDDERLHLSRSFPLSNDKAIFCPKNKKTIKKILLLKFENFLSNKEIFSARWRSKFFIWKTYTLVPSTWKCLLENIVLHDKCYFRVWENFGKIGENCLPLICAWKS